MNSPPSHENKNLHELRELLELARPAEWKRTLEALYFTSLIELGYDLLPHPDETTRRIYALISFFDEIAD